MQKNVLYISWGSLSDNDMISTMERNSLKVTRLDWKFRDYDHDSDLEKIFSGMLKKENFDFVFSFNFLPLISELCQKAGIFYISWIYDSPHLTLYSKKVKNDRNIIFHFDKKEADALIKRGCPHVFHLPLGVNTKRLSTRLANTEGTGAAAGDNRYRADISFLGSLYTGENFFDSVSYLPPELYGYLKGLMDAQMKVSVQDVITPCLNLKHMEDIKKYIKFSLGNGYEEDEISLFTDMFLLRKVSSMERVEIMEKVFEEFKNVKLYTGSETEGLLGIRSEGRADYEKEMPEVFCSSRINLNISLRTIRSGIPLRAMDIMASGGFLLSNYQPELFDYFSVGEDFDFYEDIPDLIRKCHYYLRHDKERERIAENGMSKVRKEHGMDVKLKEMMSTLSTLSSPAIMK